MLLFCTKEDSDSGNDSDGGHYFFFFPKKNGTLKKLTLDNQSLGTINVSYEDGQEKITSQNHQLTQEIREVSFEGGGQCQFSPAHLPKSGNEKVILCIKEHSKQIS